MTIVELRLKLDQIEDSEALVLIETGGVRRQVVSFETDSTSDEDGRKQLVILSSLPSVD